MFSAFPSLRHRNFQLYLSGQFVSLIGTWMQNMALSWLVYSLTHSTFWLGVVVFCGQVPSFFFAFFAGVVVDRVNRHRLLIATQFLSAVQAVLLWYLTSHGKITILEITLLSTALGIINSIDMPTRQAFVVQMIGNKKDLPNAIAISSSVMNGTRLIGPAIASLVIAELGVNACFLCNALSYVAVLIALIAMQVKTAKVAKSKANIMESIVDGVRYSFGYRPIGTILILLAIMSFVGMPYMTLYPAIAATLLKGDANTLGLITTVAAMGGFSGTIYMASRKSVLKVGRLIGFSGLVLGTGMVGMATTTRIEIILPLLFFSGLGMMLQMVCGNTLIQTLVEDDKRGRVMSMFSFSLMGVFPFGSLAIGWFAQRIGIPHTLFFCGIFCLATAIWFLSQIAGLSLEVRPLYLKLGIINSGDSGDFGAGKLSEKLIF